MTDDAEPIADPAQTHLALPPDLAARARAHGPGSPVAEPRHAATVALLREVGDVGLETYLLRRRPSMAFAPRMHVFPGGTVDPRDLDQEVAWSGPPPEHWADLLGVTEDVLRALVCAAVRETFEESGVLLAGPTADEVVGDTSDAAWEAGRVALVSHELGFADLLERRGLVLRADLLRPWARWVTPEFEERRYDTAFFVAAVPDGQRTRDVGGEADQVEWATPSDALAGLAAGSRAMLPPTATVLRELLPHQTVAAAMLAAEHREIAPLLPRPRLDVDPPVVVLPGQPGYDDLAPEPGPSA